MRLLLDTNVVLDVLLARELWVAEAQALWQANDEGRLQGYIPASTLTDLFYIVRRATDLPRARAAVVVCLDAFAICSIGRRTLEEALTLPGTDFEDNVTLACALQHGLDGIVTRDPAGFKGAAVPILTPADALLRLDYPS